MSELAPIFDLVRDAWTGRKLGRFEIICKLGSGGMSEVFLAWQRGVGGFQRPVVLKRILDHVKGQDDFVHMFVQEAKITSGLSHSGIAQLFDLSEENDELFMVMEFVPGGTLVEVARACLNAREQIPVGLTLAVVRETALALHYAHTFKDAVGRARPVVHRDIAEKNIMVSLDGKTKLLDFGIARQQGRASRTQVGTVKGTAGYMSPEQVRGERLDARTDIFSLGIVLHECLTGQRLFKAPTRQDEIAALLSGEIPPPSARNRAISPALDAVVLKALARDRGARYASALELAAAFDRLSGVEVWTEQQRADFMQRHFAKRREQIKGFIGEPSISEADFDEATGVIADPNPAVFDDGPSTVLSMRPNAPRAGAGALGVGARATRAEAMGETRDERAAKSIDTSPGPAPAEDAGATLPGEEGEDTHAGLLPGAVTASTSPGAEELTHGTDPAGSLLRRRARKGPNLQLLGMIGGTAVLVIVILLVLFW